MAAASAVAQFVFTTLFGWYATFVMVRTGSVWPAVAVHAFCNVMGAPSLKVCGPRWLPFLYYPLLVGGAWGFYVLLWPLTESANALAAFV